MKRQFALILLLAAGSLAVGSGIARGQTYSSFVTATQIHATANHWGNSKSHLLIDTVTIAVPVAVSRASWTPEGAFTRNSSMINSYDVGLHCLIGPGAERGGCEPGRLYAHTGPLLSTQTHPKKDRAVSFPLVADQNTVCQSYPCTLPVGTYSLTTGTSETARHTLSIWGDGSFLMRGGAEFHLGNSFNDFAIPDNVIIAGYVRARAVEFGLRRKHAGYARRHDAKRTSGFRKQERVRARDANPGSGPDQRYGRAERSVQWV